MFNIFTRFSGHKLARVWLYWKRWVLKNGFMSNVWHAYKCTIWVIFYLCRYLISLVRIKIQSRRYKQKSSHQIRCKWCVVPLVDRPKNTYHRNENIFMFQQNVCHLYVCMCSVCWSIREKYRNIDNSSAL